jgi:hypothetical protein
MSGPGPLLALIKYHIAAGLRMSRWRLVPPVFIAIVVQFIYENTTSPWERYLIGPDANVWDVGLSFLSNVFRLAFVLLFGFMLLIGDDVGRGYADGTMRSTLFLSRSPLLWWRAKVLAMGVFAFAYIGIVLLLTLLVSLVMGIPFELRNSVASTLIEQMQAHWYELPPGWSTMAYYLFANFSLAFTMWVIVTVHQTISLFALPNRRLSAFIFFGWVFFGFIVQPDAAYWDVRFLLYFGKVFGRYGHGHTSIPVFFGVMTAVLLAATALGHRRLQRMDL